jgi:RHS repeat-associated protein
LKDYVWLGDTPLAIIDASGSYVVHVDHLNTPRLVANQSGQTVWRWDQEEPFGNNMADENPSGLGAFDLPLRLPGQYFDKETNLHYNYFRDYDPNIGRYAESDPIGLGGGPNTYAYVRANPLSRRDPSGLLDEGNRGGGGGDGAQSFCRLIAQIPYGTPMLGVQAWYCIYLCESLLSCPPKRWVQQEISVWKWGCQDKKPGGSRPPVEPD